jgi:hypothetical protein
MQPVIEYPHCGVLGKILIPKIQPILYTFHLRTGQGSEMPVGFSINFFKISVQLFNSNVSLDKLKTLYFESSY